MSCKSFFAFAFFLLGLSQLATAQDTASTVSPESLAQQQLDAYNARDIDAFLKPYSEEVEIYNFPDQLMYTGKATMRQNYAQMFDNTPDLHCELVKRIVLGNTVIDQERVTGFGPGRVVEAVAIYKVEGDRIAKVYFVQK